MKPEIKAYLDEHYADEEPIGSERYYIDYSKLYALIRAGLIKQGSVVQEIVIPELENHD